MSGDHSMNQKPVSFVDTEIDYRVSPEDIERRAMNLEEAINLARNSGVRFSSNYLAVCGPWEILEFAEAVERRYLEKLCKQASFEDDSFPRELREYNAMTFQIIKDAVDKEVNLSIQHKSKAGADT
jgi:hypothetical protein